MLLLPWRGTAQEQGAALDGAVRDAQGGPLPGVVVVARSAAGLSVEAVSDASGVYRLSALPSGSYELSASLSGFLPVRVVGIELALGVRLTVDLVFQPAGPNEFVEVVATSPSLARTQVMRATSVSGPLIEQDASRSRLHVARLAGAGRRERAQAGRHLRRWRQRRREPHHRRWCRDDRYVGRHARAGRGHRLHR